MEQVNKEFPKSMFEWDEVSKRYGEPTPLNHYFHQSKNPLGDNLRRYYGHLQTIAIALEGTVHDMKRSRGKFADEFESLMHHLKQVLCEVLTGIGELGFADKIENKIRPIREEIKDETFRAVNNWVVFREYIMYMEYLIESCKFFKERFVAERE
ncbi:Hypothetical protein NTJ_14485 [Nesidiocoris tenuis]|uniref:Dynein heavy chain tail domain-containing protein n=1 Tax=Nesidiocoris tenuis TaxID=355587 RepID=A0ABN7BDC3_9HEMI|nr:Hypothetical protein NTJ_14485 [Nesidiocoris tenuis]